MRRAKPDMLSICLAILCLATSGCAILPESMQMKQLHKLNRGSGYSEDPFTSIIPEKNATYARTLALHNALTPESESGFERVAPATQIR